MHVFLFQTLRGTAASDVSKRDDSGRGESRRSRKTHRCDACGCFARFPKCLDKREIEKLTGRPVDMTRVVKREHYGKTC